MALPKLSPPPFNQPFDLQSGAPNPAWVQWFDLLYSYMGSGSGNFAVEYLRQCSNSFNVERSASHYERRNARR
jgi:hypothetical protein